jgi:hypothetical protein
VQTHKEAGFPQEEAAEAKLPAASAAMGLLRGVAYELNEALALGLAVPQQCRCACYEGNGARYVAHRDNVCVDAQGEIDCHNSREVTVKFHPLLHNVDIKTPPILPRQAAKDITSQCRETIDRFSFGAGNTLHVRRKRTHPHLLLPSALPVCLTA